MAVKHINTTLGKLYFMSLVNGYQFFSNVVAFYTGAITIPELFTLLGNVLGGIFIVIKNPGNIPGSRDQ